MGKDQVRSPASGFHALRLAPKNATDTRSCLLWRRLLNCRRGRSRRTTPRNGFRCVLVRRVIAFAERTRGALAVDCSLAFTPNAGWTRGRGHRYRAAAAWDHSSTHSPLGSGTIPFCHSFFHLLQLAGIFIPSKQAPSFLPRSARCVHNCAT